MKKSVALALLVLLALTSAFTQTHSSMLNNAPTPKKEGAARSTGSESKLPGAAEIDASLKRTLGYDPAVTWEILDIKPSVVPGLTEVIVSINKQGANRLLVTPDGKNALVVADIIPFGADPFAPARSLLQGAAGPARGAQSPVITIVEFSDLQCPHCKAAQPVLEKLAGDFPQVRYVFQQFPLPASLHPWAAKAAAYSDCSAQGGDKESFWKYTDSIFENQGGIALATADDKLKELATAAGLDAAKIATCAAAPATEARVRKSLELGQSLEVNETPTVFINGRRVKSIGSIPYDQLKSLVQFEIDHAGK
ncbi:MAG TPA: thioredoxin domain-containing protein [Candidatus Angelobacter sp.]|nr:thioredoxin domain-containing protein [Candidatus Angelobacter sp.]